jgi:uncharacterized protein (UPF0276 family)
MLSSVNYSLAAAELLKDGFIEVDRFKCPAWPDSVREALQYNDVYVHFPLRAGTGKGYAINIETGQPADLDQVEALLIETNTPVVNLHLATTVDDFPEIPIDSLNPEHIEKIATSLVDDVNSVANRFGKESIVVENVYHGNGEHPRPVYLPEVINSVVNETGVGFLFDLSHARLAAEHMGADIYEYISGLPTRKTREVHVTGIQRFEGHWIDIAQMAGFDPQLIEQYKGRLVDHLPMTENDWTFLTWALEQIKEGNWGTPWVVTFEYGGIGSQFASITDSDVLREQVPRLEKMVKEAAERD